MSSEAAARAPLPLMGRSSMSTEVSGGMPNSSSSGETREVSASTAPEALSMYTAVSSATRGGKMAQYGLQPLGGALGHGGEYVHTADEPTKRRGGDDCGGGQGYDTVHQRQSLDKTAAAARPTPTEKMELSQTAGRISKGAAEPAAARSEAAVVGMSCMEAVFITTRRQSSSEAAPSESRAMPEAARMPTGVAALPRPSKLAETLEARADMVSQSWAERGNSRVSRGESARERASSAPGSAQHLHDAAPEANQPAGFQAQLYSGRGPGEGGGAGGGGVPGGEARIQVKRATMLPIL